MRAAKIVAISLIGLAVAAPAAAQSDYCYPLQQELAALDRAGGGRSAGNIRSELSSARSEARRNGCTGGLFSRKRGRHCGEILSRISRLQRQLAQGDGPRGFFFGRSAQERQRDRILQALARAGCSRGGGDGGWGGYRTVCVRACDGYYFPLSFATGRQKFQQDSEKCLAQYPPGEATLFYYSNSSGDPSQAVSLSGERYADQPYAFAYRQSFHAQCAAQLHQGLALLGERVIASLPPPPPKVPAFEKTIETRFAYDVPIPIARVDRSTDPETAANRAGGLVPRLPGSVPVAEDGTRMVGDPYLFAEANPGPPPTIDGFKPPELKDFRTALRASMLPSPN